MFMTPAFDWSCIVIIAILLCVVFIFQTELHLGRHGLNLTWMADRSSCFLEQGGSRDSLRDAWTQCLAGLLEPDLLPTMCPSSIHIAWPYAYNRMVKAYGVLDPG